jgi:hypothetical protein
MRLTRFKHNLFKFFIYLRAYSTARTLERAGELGPGLGPRARRARNLSSMRWRKAPKAFRCNKSNVIFAPCRHWFLVLVL